MLNKIFFAPILLTLMPLSVHADIIYDTWTTNEGETGNYELTVSDNLDNSFTFDLVVDPWNAEPLGMFVDLGAQDVDGLDITGVTSGPTTLGTVVFVATDTSSNSCGGNGCNLDGLSPPVADPDGEWEMVFRLGEQGFEGYSNFTWTVTGLTGVQESDFGLVGIRSQQLCDAGQLLPDGTCEGSDKSYSSDGPNPPSGVVPLPAAAWLFGSALLGLTVVARRKAAV